MRFIRPSILLALVAALIALTVSAPATAGGINVRVVSGTTTTGATAATATSVGGVTFEGSSSSALLSCSSAAIPSSPVSTANLGSSVLDILSIQQVNFSGCSGIGGAMTFTTTGSWRFHATSGATIGSSDTVQGHVENVSFTANNNVCQVTMAGTIRAAFSETLQRLILNDVGGSSGQFKVTSVNPSRPCLGRFVVGEIVKVGVTLAYTFAKGLLRIG